MIGNAILDPKIDKVGKGASHDLVDRFRLDHPGREMWMCLDRSPSVRVRSYLDRVLEALTLILLRVPRSTMQHGLHIGLLGPVYG